MAGVAKGLPLVCLVFGMFIHTGVALFCVKCHTDDTDDCMEPFPLNFTDFDQDDFLNHKLIQDCGNATDVQCQKYVTSAFANERITGDTIISATRVTRECVHTEYPDTCWVRDSPGATRTVCNCGQDGCNHGNMKAPYMITVTLALLMTSLIYVFRV